MIPRKLIIPGGYGYLGRFLTKYLAGHGHEVVVLTRNSVLGGTARQSRSDASDTEIRCVSWDGTTPGAWITELENADAVINLAGRSVNCRYNRCNKQVIYDSRLKSTAVLGKAIAACSHPPKVWINSSTATIYRHAEDREMDELTGEIGHGFSVDVAQKWEAALNNAQTRQTRKVALRSAMVMGPGNDGVFEAFHRLVRWKLGGAQGNGRQFVSWIHWQDFVRAIEWIIENESLSGPVNVASLKPLTNREFMKTLREADRESIGLSTPGWLLEIGAVFLRTETELVLKSRRVIPSRLLASGFIFNHTHWSGAVRDLLKQPMHPLLMLDA
ncbi:MAG TPA: TIGR01777 family oxidoreductase [Chthoniobacterales bacterium]